MRKIFSILTVAMLSLALAACGGGGEGSKFETPGGGSGTTPPGPAASSVTVIASTPTLPSNGSAPVQISAFVRDANNQFMSGQTVAFAADSGGLQVVQATTDANGLATANLTTAGDPSNRTITVRATAGTVSGSASINVGGSQLSIQGPAALVIGQQATYTIALIDSGNTGVANQSVALTSARGNALSAPTVTTNAAGQATFTLNISNSGSDTLTARAMGMTATLAISVNSDSFAFTAPTPAQEIPLGVSQAVSVRWTQNNVPIVGQPISFASTRGTLDNDTMLTDATGTATVHVTAMNAGGAVISASATGGAASQQTVEFVATSVASIDVQPTAFAIAPNEVSTITAVVRDAANNLVKNKTVTFSLEDVTGGKLSTASAITDSQGRAQSAYTAGTVASAQNGVKVTATIQGTTIKKTVSLTVAQRQLFMVLGTGNEIAEPNTAQYRLDYIVQVTDANGGGVSGVPLTLSAVSTRYFKGKRDRASTSDPWGTTIYKDCADEDTNHNGVLDPTEDFNANTRIEAGNIATVAPGTVTSGANGFATISVFYPQEYAYYLEVKLEVSASVQGTEFARSSTFILPGSKDDFAPAATPPGPISPFGVANSCSNPN